MLSSGPLSGSGILASQRDTAKWPPTLLLRRLLSVLRSMGGLCSLDQDLFDIDEIVLYTVRDRSEWLRSWCRLCIGSEIASFCVCWR